MRRFGILLLCLNLFVLTCFAEVVVTKESSGWRCYPLMGKVPIGWAAVAFDDSRWTGAPAPDVKGVLFRRRFHVEDLPSVERALVKLRFQDGVLVYLNGVEWFRANMPPGFIDERTPAVSARDGAEARSYESWNLDPALLEDGRNVLAISVHSGVEDPKRILNMDLGMTLDRMDQVLPKQPKRAGRRVSWERAASVANAIGIDWKVTAFEFEEDAKEAYDREDWKAAAEAYTRGLLAYKYASHGMALVPELKQRFLSEPTLAREFLELLSPHDHQQRVFEILNELHADSETRFAAYPRVAFAIALVYDQEPPSRWPHGQVSRKALPRRLPDPTEAFEFFVKSEESGQMLFSLDRLMIEELKYVVDIVAPFEELRWAQKELRPKRRSVEKLYGSIIYDLERLNQGQLYWLDPDDYRLETILDRGGICADQSYYMTQVAKAYGVPCITVTGMVKNGRHAWVGFMEGPGQWNFKAGRSAESTYATGRTFDPQSWRRPMEYELAFLKERLAFEPKYRLSILHGCFARMALREGDDDRALTLAREALMKDSRNLDAWELLMDQTDEPLALEALCRNAARAVRKYPDLEAGYLRRLVSLLSKRGEEVEAERVRGEIIRRNHAERPDLAMAEASRELAAATRDQPIDLQIRLFKRQLSQFREGGMLTMNQMVEPFVRHLIREGEKVLALQAIDHARKRLVVTQPVFLEKALTALGAQASSWRE